MCSEHEGCLYSTALWPTFSFLLLSWHGRRLKAVLEEKGAVDFSV